MDVSNLASNVAPQTSLPNFLDSETDFSNSALLYQSVIQNIAVGIVKHNPDGQIVLCNNKALEMLGLSEDELYGKTSIDPSWNVIHEDGSEFPGIQHPSSVAIATKQAVKDVVMGIYCRKTKNRVWLMVNAEPQFDVYGSLLHVLVTFTDITAYKKVKDELRIKNQMLENFSQNSIDMFGIMDVTGRYHYVSKAAMVISGYTQQELLQVNALDLAPKKTKDFIKQLLLDMPVVGRVENMIGKIICKDDTVKYISWSFQWDANSELIYVNGRDKTQQVKDTRALEAMRIAEEQQKRHLIFEVEEQKRHTIGYELHENVGQIIATVKMYLDSYDKTANDRTLQESKDLLTVCIDELRTITYINSIPNFSEVGFANAIEILMQLHFKKQTIVHALDIAIDEAAISEINRINIYRLIQLWLSHIAQREGLLSVLIRLDATEDELTLQITDEVSKAQNYTDYLSPDLMPIKERLNIIGGTMALKPSADSKCFAITFLLKKDVH
jgi:PAS domain S-box-containing protein